MPRPRLVILILALVLPLACTAGQALGAGRLTPTAPGLTPAPQAGSNQPSPARHAPARAAALPQTGFPVVGELILAAALVALGAGMRARQPRLLDPEPVLAPRR